MDNPPIFIEYGGDDMEPNRQLAIELAKALIQNNHVKPVFGVRGSKDIGDENTISYILSESSYSFSELVSHFLDNIEKIEKWSF